MQVAAERSGEAIDRTVLAAFTKMMTELGKHVYINELEKPFLEASQAHFECVLPSMPLRSHNVAQCQ